MCAPAKWPNHCQNLKQHGRVARTSPVTFNLFAFRGKTPPVLTDRGGIDFSFPEQLLGLCLDGCVWTVLCQCINTLLYKHSVYSCDIIEYNLRKFLFKMFYYGTKMSKPEHDGVLFLAMVLIAISFYCQKVWNVYLCYLTVPASTGHKQCSPLCAHIG